MRLGHLTSLALVSALGTTSSCARHEARDAAAVVPAGTQARARGVEGYRVIHEDARDLDVELVGARAGRLRSHGTAVAVEQRLTGVTATDIALIATVDRVELETGGRRVIVTRRSGGGWERTSTLGDDDIGALALCMAVDVDLGVQGTALVLGGTAYAQCTFDCLFAASCAARWNEADASCQRAVASCASCMAAGP